MPCSTSTVTMSLTIEPGRCFQSWLTFVVFYSLVSELTAFFAVLPPFANSFTHQRRFLGGSMFEPPVTL